jgi:hypothetical protein
VHVSEPGKDSFIYVLGRGVRAGSANVSSVYQSYQGSIANRADCTIEGQNATRISS